jgi:hypothetical protein
MQAGRPRAHHGQHRLLPGAHLVQRAGALQHVALAQLAQVQAAGSGRGRETAGRLLAGCRTAG